MTRDQIITELLAARYKYNEQLRRCNAWAYEQLQAGNFARFSGAPMHKEYEAADIRWRHALGALDAFIAQERKP